MIHDTNFCLAAVNLSTINLNKQVWAGQVSVDWIRPGEVARSTDLEIQIFFSPKCWTGQIGRNYSDLVDLMFGSKNIGTQKNVDSNFYGLIVSLAQSFSNSQIFLFPKSFWIQTLFGPKFIWGKTLLIFNPPIFRCNFILYILIEAKICLFWTKSELKSAFR